MNILYLFPGSFPRADGSTTQLYGYDRMSSFGLQVRALTRDDALPVWFLRTPLSRYIDFKLKFALLYFKARSTDIVFGPGLLYLMPFKKLFGGRARYVVLNTELNRILRGSPDGSLRTRILASLMREFGAIVCLSTDQEKWLLTHFPFLAGKTFFVPLGADTHFYTPVYDGRGPVILSVGKDNGRDYRTLIEAAKRMPDTRFEIVCSPRNLQGISDIPRNVSVFYDISPRELTQKYQSAQMIIIATYDDASILGADCSGQTVLLDAMASGLPVIASRKAYLDDYVSAEHDALIVPPNDPGSLVMAIIRLQKDASLRIQIATRARTRAEQECSVEIMAQSIASIIGHVAGVENIM